MFRRYNKRSSNPIVTIFRLILSLTMLGFLILVSYSAYKHFSGLDPLSLSPESVINSVTDYKDFPPFLENLLSSLKIKGVVEKQNTLGQFVEGLNPVSGNKSENNLNHGQRILTFILVADSHTDNFNLERALTQAKQSHPEAEFIIGLGDYSQVGTVDELRGAKEIFDKMGLRYFLTAGDHDLWHSRDQDLPAILNFNEVFGPEYQSFTSKTVKIIIIHNSDNYLGIDNEQMDWISRQIAVGKEQNYHILVFLHEPLYHPSSDHFMGRLEPKLKDQAKSLIQLFSRYGVKKVFAGDAHYFSEYFEPETNLAMVTIGAVTAERNPQAPRYGVVSVFEDGFSRVDDIEIK